MEKDTGRTATAPAAQSDVRMEKESTSTTPTLTTMDGEKDPSNLDLVTEEEEKADKGFGHVSQDAQMPVQEPEGPPPLTKGRKVIIVCALCLAVLLSALDQTIITTAVPVLAAQFNSPSAYTWVGSAYMLGSAALLPSWGKFSDIWGRKPVLLTAMTLFLIGSIFCSAAQDIALMLVGRVVQGLGAGGILGLVNVTIADIVSIRERGLYLSFLGMTWAFASAIGPVLGGVFTGMAEWGWRFCFIINIPMGLIAMSAIYFLLHLRSPKIGIRDGLKRVDWLGTATIIAGTLLFLLGLEFGGVNHPWDSPLVICFLIFGILLLIVFTLVEWKIAALPVIPLRLFATRTNACAYLMAITHGIVFLGGCYFLPFYFQSVRGVSPLMSGVSVLPYVIPLSLASGMTGVIIAKTGRYQEVIWGGTVIMTLGTGLMLDLDRESNWVKLFFYQAIAGIGSGPLFQGPLIAIHSTLKPQDIGSATTTFQFLRTLGTALSVCIGLVVFQNQMANEIPSLARKLPAEVLGLLTGGSASANVERVSNLPERERHIVQDAYAKGTRGMWYFFLACAAVCMIASAGIGKHELSKKVQSSQPAMERREKKNRSDEEVAKTEEKA